jgi:hypothetical protein
VECSGSDLKYYLVGIKNGNNVTEQDIPRLCLTSCAEQACYLLLRSLKFITRFFIFHAESFARFAELSVTSPRGHLLFRVVPFDLLDSVSFTTTFGAANGEGMVCEWLVPDKCSAFHQSL